jgi:L-lactate dehydrogenase complex protein LldF
MSSRQPPSSFRSRAIALMKDRSVNAAVKLGTARKVIARLKAWGELGEPEVARLRAAAKAAKAKVMRDLPAYWEQFRSQVEGRGGQVRFCQDGAAACRAVAEIALAAGARLAVKSKSMATEEIHLNSALAAASVEAVETDLGEFILQLAGETPSHIVGPAMHKNRFDVAALFSKDAGRTIAPEPAELLAYARARLRQAFVTADIGITGCNVAVAETGSVCLFTNEGNARLVTSQPRIHIVVVGIEKLVATWEDYEPILALLARSATGQRITAYSTVVNGPRLPGEIDGPDEMHVIVMDNGRSRLLGTPYEEALHCIRCASCLNVCPVYRQTGGHAYAPVYSGPIGAVLNPLLNGMEEYCDLPLHATSLCGACSDACPVGIPLHELLQKLRVQAVAEGRVSGGERLSMRLWGWLWSSPLRYRLFARIARLLSLPLSRGGWLRWAPGIAAGWTAYRDLPAPRGRLLRDRMIERGLAK